MKKRVAFATLGCKVNQFETAEMIQQFHKADYRIVKFSEEADLYIVNTCTVTGRSDAESRRLIRRAKRCNPNARIVATGCYAQVSPDELASLPDVDQILGNEEKQDIFANVTRQASLVSDLTSLKKAGPLRLTCHTEHTRAFLQIQNGCEQRCTYCIVPEARGPNRSVPLEDVLKASLRLTSSGHKELVLTGIHLGAYGTDLSPKSSLFELLQILISESDIRRLRLGSIEPNELTDELLSLVSSTKQICRHLHLPLQSGSDTVLRRMGRNYDSNTYRALVQKVSDVIPDAFIAADVIAGFPGETQEEFEQTFGLIDELPVSDLHVFPYSLRKGTIAAGMPEHLKPSVITERAAALRKLAEEKRKKFINKFIGRTLPVLGLRRNIQDKTVTGLSGNYLEIRYSGGDELINREVSVEITSAESGQLTGRVTAPAGVENNAMQNSSR